MDRVQETFERLFGPEFGHGKAFDRARLLRVLDALGGPQVNIGPVFHIAGTNGKGSTIAFMRAIAEAAELQVSAFTKPHLLRLNERFIVRGVVADDDALVAMAERIAAIDPGITQFDAQVATAFALFDESPGDVTLIETGMGGRDDSTNVVSWPTASIITPIGLDHQDVLGATLKEIAWHKAGIMKRNSPAVIARQADEAREVIETFAEHIGAPLFRQGVEWDAYENNGRLVVQTENRALDLPRPSLLGRHQIDNAGLACAAFLAPGPFNLDDEAFAIGIARAQLPARLQLLTRGRLSAPIRAAGGEVWIDGGHNAHAAQALAIWLNGMQRKRAATAVAIVGIRSRKDAEAFFSALAPSLDRLIAVPLAEAHVAPVMINAICDAFDVASSQAPSLQAAMQAAARFPAPRVLICGSFLLAAEALRFESA